MIGYSVYIIFELLTYYFIDSAGMISVVMLCSWTCILHVHERKNWNIFVISKILPGFIIWLESYVSDTFVIMSKLFTDFLVKIWIQINIYTLKDKESAVMGCVF